MNNHWGVFDIGQERHVVPTIEIDGELMVSNLHTLHRDCRCHPSDIQNHQGDYHLPIWNHNSPEHPGSKEREEG